jgi:hypothetical protein
MPASSLETQTSALQQPGLVYPVKLSYLIEGETKTFHNKEKLKEFENIKSALQKILKGLLHIEEETRV